MTRLTCVLLFFLAGSVCPVLAQKKVNGDSLLRVFNNPATADTNRLKAIHTLSWSQVFVHPDSAIKLANLEKAMARQKKNKRYESNAYNTIGVAWLNMGNTDSALANYSEALRLRLVIKDARGQAVTLNNIGIVYYKHGDYSQSLDYYQRSLHLKDSLGDASGVAAAYSNIGMIYEDMGDREKSLSCYYTALHLRDSLKDVRGMADAYSKIGGYYVWKKDYVKGKEFVQKSAHYADEAGDTKSLGNALANLGLICERMGDSDSAQYYYALALDIREKSHDEGGIASSYYGMGSFENHRGNYDKALAYCNKALEMAESLEFPDIVQSSCSCLADAYEQKKDFQKAFLYYKRASILSDSLGSVAKSKEIARKQIQYDYEKRKLSDSLRVAKEDELKDVKHHEEIHQQKIYTAAGITGFLLMLALAFVLYRGFRLKQRSNSELETKNRVITQQKQEVEFKNREILDSITYAQRLQEAILPPWKQWQKQLPESFLFYRPKDLVAGDFFWMENGLQPGALLFAVADCTGHGVPGALVSVVCSNALDRAVKEFRLTDPGKILDRVSELVIETFEKSGNGVQDGMDISLVHYDRQTQTIHWAGANNPLWIIRCGASEITELRPNKQPVGMFQERRPFETKTTTVAPGDLLFLFTDGFADQFGGPYGKKFKYRQLQELLLKNAPLSIEEQKKAMTLAFDEWKGPLEQIDDVCVIGVRIG